MRPSKTSRSLLVLGGLLLGGCSPTCEQVCTKLVACEELGTERMSAAECEEQCELQEKLYATWHDTQLRQSFDEHLSCLNDTECADIAAGACYEDEVFTF